MTVGMKWQKIQNQKKGGMKRRGRKRGVNQDHLHLCFSRDFLPLLFSWAGKEKWEFGFQLYFSVSDSVSSWFLLFFFLQLDSSSLRGWKERLCFSWIRGIYLCFLHPHNNDQTDTFRLNKKRHRAVKKKCKGRVSLFSYDLYKKRQRYFFAEIPRVKIFSLSLSLNILREKRRKTRIQAEEKVWGDWMATPSLCLPSSSLEVLDGDWFGPCVSKKSRGKESEQGEGTFVCVSCEEKRSHRLLKIMSERRDYTFNTRRKILPCKHRCLVSFLSNNVFRGIFHPLISGAKQ